jgi:hypothetical protein
VQCSAFLRLLSPRNNRRPSRERGLSNRRKFMETRRRGLDNIRAMEPHHRDITVPALDGTQRKYVAFSRWASNSRDRLHQRHLACSPAAGPGPPRVAQAEAFGRLSAFPRWLRGADRFDCTPEKGKVRRGGHGRRSSHSLRLPTSDGILALRVWACMRWGAEA